MPILGHIQMMSKTNRPTLFATLIICLVVLTGCATQNSLTQIERIVVFGDSNVDTGNLATLFGDADPRTNIWQGRNSNGPLVSEYLAESLDAELVTYAVSGATTGNTNIVSLLAPQLTALANTGMLSQIAEFSNNKGTLGEHDLIILWAGSNDIFRAQRDKKDELNQRINGATANIISAIDLLTELGAKKVVIATRTPRQVLDSDDDMNGQDLNHAVIKSIQTKLAQSNNELVLFDAYTAIKDIIVSPQSYGLADVSKLCIENLKCSSEKYQDGLELANTYLNWDAAHKTTRVHSILAEKLGLLLKD
ncbi:MAG: thermolabile hemolysin [Arenicella sp.]|jgi:thermolabile hemolysin